MAKLNSIFISGIRSYGITKEDAQVIQFQSPVTLFLGQNGCGKTTIIESVKHALTGDFPFSGKTGGQTFVTDPTLYKLSHVKGCIKLKFCDVYGKPASITRILKLEYANKKMKCSTEDTSYCYIDRNGIERALSVKIADCKEMIMSLVGVSEAVLNNVLFCHQEDSLWPLSEDGNVKKKFDQIFDSARYDAAMDVYARLIKQHSETVRNLNKELTYLKEAKENAQRKKNSLKDKESSLNILNNETEDLLKRKLPLKEKLDEVIGMEESYCHLHKMKSNKESEIKSNRNLQESIIGLIQFPFEGTDEELEREIANFHAQFLKKKQELEKIEVEIKKVKDNTRNITDKQQDKKGKLAGLEEQTKSYNLKLNERKELVTKLLTKYKSPVSQTYSKNFDLMVKNLDNERDVLAKKEKELSHEEQKIQKKIDEFHTAFIDCKSRETIKSQELQAAKEAKLKTETQLEDLSASDIEFKNYEAKIIRAQKEIDKVLASFNEENANRTLEKNRKKIRHLRETLEELDLELKTFLKNSVIEEKIEGIQNDKIYKEKEIRNMKNKHHNQFKLLFEDNPPIKNFSGEVGRMQAKYSQNLQKLKKGLADKEKQASKLNADLSVKKMELTNMKKELSDGKLKIGNLCGNEGFETKRNQVSEKNRILQKEKGTLSALKVIFKEFVKEISNKKCCPVCETDFSNQLQIVERVAAKMNDKIRSVPERLQDITLELTAGEKLHGSLMELNPIHLKLTTLQNNIESKQEEVTNLERKHSQILQEINTLKIEGESNQKLYDAAVTIMGSAGLIDQYCEDVVSADMKISELKGKIILIDSNRTKTETETSIEETKEEITQLNDENDRLSKRSNACQSRLHELRTQKSNLVDAQLKLRQAVQGKPQLIEKLKELEQKVVELDNLMSDISDQMLMAISDLEQAKNELLILQGANSRELKQIKLILQNNESAFKDIERLNAEIERIEQKNLSAACDAINSEISKINSVLEQFEQQAIELNSQRDKLKDKLRDEDATDKSLQNTKKLRELQRDEAKLASAIKALNSDLGDKNYNSIAEERNKLQKKISDIESNLANIEGQIKALKENIKDITKELSNYRTDPIKSYLMKVCEIKFVQMMIEDYRKTSELVSGALCKFHCEQLSSINIRLKELWQAIYRGNDIDYIQIQSGETDVARQRRQFSYCVIQKKGSMVTQMRGKCSAGQKVLACLLVRIVLAEHFSLKCGIFALDEPTTNLDRENIKSLSSAIASLITNHRAQANFQFLIITHDEEFLDSLREADALENFYKVQRNVQGRSIVTREKI